MQLIWTALVALCLAAASAARPVRIEIGYDRAASVLAAAPDALPTAAVKARRRAVALPDGLSPVTTVAAPTELTPPRAVIGGPAPAATDRPARPLVCPRSSRGPPLG